MPGTISSFCFSVVSTKERRERTTSLEIESGISGARDRWASSRRGERSSIETPNRIERTNQPSPFEAETESVGKPKLRRDLE